MATKTGLNSATRRLVRDRQDNRCFSVIGVVCGLLLLMSVVFGNEDDVPVLQGEPGEIGLADLDGEPRVHPLVAYANGLSRQEMDAKLEGLVSASGR